MLVGAPPRRENASPSLREVSPRLRHGIRAIYKHSPGQPAFETQPLLHHVELRQLLPQHLLRHPREGLEGRRGVAAARHQRRRGREDVPGGVRARLGAQELLGEEGGPREGCSRREGGNSMPLTLPRALGRSCVCLGRDLRGAARSCVPQFLNSIGTALTSSSF